MAEPITDHQSFHEGLQRDGFDPAVEAVVEPDRINTEHAHDHDVRALVLEGEITLTVDGASTLYRAGEQFVMPRGCHHAETFGPHGLKVLVGRRY